MDAEKKRPPIPMSDHRDLAAPAGNPAAEQALLGAILIAPEALTEAIQIVRSDDFSMEAYRAIYTAAVSLYEHNKPADYVTVADELQRRGELEDVGGIAGLGTLGNHAPSSLNISHYAQIVARTGDRRRLLNAWQHNAALGLDSEIEPLEAISKAQADLTSLADRITYRQGDGLPRILDAQSLIALMLPEPIWTAEGVLAQGATLLCGPPKLGKSWLCLNLALAVASGGSALGGYTCTTQGSVLYLALEDTWQRLQERLLQMLAGEPAPLCFELAREWPTLDDGCAEAIDRWARTKPDARLVIVDTLAKVRGLGQRPGDEGAKGSLYQADYADVSRLKRVADRRGLTVLIVHHLRKMTSPDDPFEEISGTQGILGAADDALILKPATVPLGPNGQKTYSLFGRGRNIEDIQLAMRFDNALGLWTALGNQEELSYTQLQGDVIALIRANGFPMSARQIAEELGHPYDSTRRLLARMTMGQLLARMQRGKYSLAEGAMGQ